MFRKYANERIRKHEQKKKAEDESFAKRQMKIKERQKQSKEKNIPKDSRKIFAREGERLIAIFLVLRYDLSLRYDTSCIKWLDASFAFSLDRKPLLFYKKTSTVSLYL